MAKEDGKYNSKDPGYNKLGKLSEKIKSMPSWE